MTEGAEKIQQMSESELVSLRNEFQLDISTERVKGKLEYEGPDKIVINGRSMNIQTGITVYGNEGHTTLPASSRTAWFWRYVFNEVSLVPNCVVDQCRTYNLVDVLHGLKG